MIDPFTPFINKLSGGRFSVTSAQLARSLIGVAKNGAREHILDNRTIRAA